MLAKEFEKTTPGLCAFAWPLGGVALAWGPHGIARVTLGDGDLDRLIQELRAALASDRARGAAAVPAEAPRRDRAPAPVAQVCRRLRALLRGSRDLLTDVPVDLGGRAPFAVRVYAELRKVAPGEVVTYGELAARAGRPRAARAVGRIMGANPVPLLVPCHRCLGGDGTLTGFSGSGGILLKARLLHAEGYDLNPAHSAGIAHLRRADRRLRPIIDAAGPYLAVADRPADPYETLVTAIVHQQLSVKAGRTIAARVRALTPGPQYPEPQRMLELDPALLRAAGLSTMKVSYVRDLAARVADGRLRLRALHRMSDEEVVATLTTVKGIGVWSAHMHLIFHLGRLDVLPVGDLGLRMAAAKVYGLSEPADPKELTRIAEPWRPYRSLGSWYLWRALDSGGV